MDRAHVTHPDVDTSDPLTNCELSYQKWQLNGMVDELGPGQKRTDLMRGFSA